MPSGPPVNVTVEAESSTSLFISWQPPETLKQNGIITSYGIEIRQSDPVSQLHTYNATADTMSIRVTGEEIVICYAWLLEPCLASMNTLQVWRYTLIFRW